MQVTIEIPDAAEKRALSKGETLEQFVIGLVKADLRTAPEPQPRISISEMLDRIGRYGDKIPQLPDEAFTRESFYQDHD